MTFALLISVAPRSGNAFVMIAADSLAVSPENNERNEKAKKIFDAGNALMTTSGLADDEYREKLAKFLKEETDDTLAQKMEALKDIMKMDKNDYDLQLNVGLVQFDVSGNPQMGIYGVKPGSEDNSYGPITFNKNAGMIEKAWIGDAKEEEIEDLYQAFEKRVAKGKVNKASVEKAATWFIREIAKMYPDTVNGFVQTKILRP